MAPDTASRIEYSFPAVGLAGVGATACSVRIHDSRSASFPAISSQIFAAVHAGAWMCVCVYVFLLVDFLTGGEIPGHCGRV